MDDEKIQISEGTSPAPDPEQISFPRENPEIINHILELIHDGRDDELVPLISDLYEADTAHIIEKLDFEEGLYLFDRLDPETQGNVLLELEDPVRYKFLDHLSSQDLAKIVQEQQSDGAVDLLSDLELNEISEILSRMPLEERINVTELLSYPENSAGALMSKEFVVVNEKDTVKKAIQTIRKISKETDDIHTVFVTDSEGIYRGHINLSKLILSRPQTRIKKIMETELHPVPVDMDQEDVANFFTRYDFITVPVVDERGVMLGRITVDDILEVMQEEASEDILRMGGVSSEETLATPLHKASLFRILWLILNLATAFLAANVVHMFEGTIHKVVILAALMPIVAGMGGNAASQTMAVIIRNIALGEITSANAKGIILRETIIGLINGLGLGLLTGAVVYFFVGNPTLGMVIFLALLFNMMVASMAGTMIPLFLKKIKVDPAIASGIFVTTLTDVIGFFAFLGLASLLLPYLM